MNERKWRWIRVGHCNMCGDCCNLNSWYGEQVKNPSVDFDEDGRCKFQDKETKKCMIQKAKPLVCVLFPQHPSELTSLPNCSFRFVREYNDKQ